jgi:hypothetical protein
MTADKHAKAAARAWAAEHGVSYTAARRHLAAEAAPAADELAAAAARLRARLAALAAGLTTADVQDTGEAAALLALAADLLSGPERALLPEAAQTAAGHLAALAPLAHGATRRAVEAVRRDAEHLAEQARTIAGRRCALGRASLTACAAGPTVRVVVEDLYGDAPLGEGCAAHAAERAAALDPETTLAHLHGPAAVVAEVRDRYAGARRAIGARPHPDALALHYTR